MGGSCRVEIIGETRKVGSTAAVSSLVDAAVGTKGIETGSEGQFGSFADCVIFRRFLATVEAGLVAFIGFLAGTFGNAFRPQSLPLCFDCSRHSGKQEKQRRTVTQKRPGNRRRLRDGKEWAYLHSEGVLQTDTN